MYRVSFVVANAWGSHTTAKKLQEMLSYESETTSKDPLGAAMEMMFQQGNLPSSSRNADGSITYLW